MEISINLSPETVAFISKLPSILKDGVQEGFNKALLYTEGESKKNFGKPGHLKVRTGNLRRSIYSKVSGLKGYVASDVKYASIHQYGGIIKPKNGKYLKFNIGGHWKTLRQVIIPARPFIIPNESNIIDIMSKTIEEVFNGS